MPSRRRGYLVSTTPDKRQHNAPDLVKRQYVATDVFSRKVVGWAFGAHMTADIIQRGAKPAEKTCYPLRMRDPVTSCRSPSGNSSCNGTGRIV